MYGGLRGLLTTAGRTGQAIVGVLVALVAEARDGRRQAAETPAGPMRLVFAEAARQDQPHWQRTDPKIVRRITGGHRYVYKAIEGDRLIAQLRYRY